MRYLLLIFISTFSILSTIQTTTALPSLPTLNVKKPTLSLPSFAKPKLQPKTQSIKTSPPPPPPPAPPITPPISKNDQSSTLSEMALSGALATMIGDMAMHPLDCIKTLQQSTSGSSLSLTSAAKYIWNTQGINGFYKGLGTYVGTDGVAGAIKFGAYEVLKAGIASRDKKYQMKLDQYNADKMMWNNNLSHFKSRSSVVSFTTLPPPPPMLTTQTLTFLSAGLAFLASSILLVPGELIKQRLQCGTYTSLSEGLTTILRTEGVPGLYRGWTGVCARDVPYTMMELGMYDTFKGIYQRQRQSAHNRKGLKGSVGISSYDEILVAATVGGFVGYLTNPLDCLKTKVMIENVSFTTALQNTVSRGTPGMLSLFDGGGARVLWLMPFTGIYLPCYDFFKRGLRERRLTRNKE